MNKIVIIKSLALIFLSQIIAPVICQQQCPVDQVWDIKLNKCIPRLDCSSQLDDDPKCLNLNCLTDSQQCPKKCFCEQPSALTNYCLPCLNGGYLDTTTCKCTCKFGFQGPTCQYQPDPCQAEDDVYCANVDCYNSTDAEFFKCPQKCMCCKNKDCKNLGKLKSDGSCGCECLVLTDLSGKDLGVYDPNQSCEIVAGICADDHACAIQLFPKKNNNCQNEFVRTLCPKSCGVCV